ncbi:MAG TPA: hypothetical protein VEW48_16160 [Thermoanaerobaculia bacterium]|nr:hypothetical protein [Thermoanaerobaculia bacterium]
MQRARIAFPLAWWRPFLALLAGLALALGMMAPHDVAMDLAGMISPVEIAETAVHPLLPVHVEDAEIKVHPGCVACLLQLGSSTIMGRPPAPPLLLPPAGHVAALVAKVSSAKPSLPGPARAPPVASPSA